MEYNGFSLDKISIFIFKIVDRFYYLIIYQEFIAIKCAVSFDLLSHLLILG